jgi:Domain of unknown function (DUF4388)
MSFSGDLEHLPIVDVIQLLHQTRKSGILRVKSRKGESQLVFKDGYMVSANHLNNKVRIGQILVDLKVIAPETLEQALQAQQQAGAEERKPLIVTLVENGLVKEEDAYKGLEHLIEMTIVEILTWKKGTFILEVLPETRADDYRYYPESMRREINLDTQSVLMEALRIFDEKMRDGELVEEEYPEEDQPQEGGAGDGTPSLSADDLGLADLDQLERKIPEVFSGLTEFDPTKAHRQKIAEVAPELSPAEQDELARFLGNFSLPPGTTEGGDTQGENPQSVIFFSADELLQHAVITVCKRAGILVLATGEEQDLDPVIVRSLAINSIPVVVFDSPEESAGPFSPERITLLRQQKKEKFPQLCAIQLAAPADVTFFLQSYGDGVRAVIPRPRPKERRETFVADLCRFLETFQAYFKGYAGEQENRPAGRLQTGTIALGGLREAPEVALALLESVSAVFARSLTLVVRESELIAEKGIGVKGEKERGATPLTGLRIPLAKSSLFRKVIEEGRLFYGKAEDEAIRTHLHGAIGAPLRATALLLPLKCRGKTISLTYGDFGDREPARVGIDLLEILARQAELVLENSLYRKRLEKLPAGQ